MSEAEALEPVRLADGTPETFMVFIGGKSWRCPCGCNVFTKPDRERPEIYECNACEAWYEGE